MLFHLIQGFQPEYSHLQACLLRWFPLYEHLFLTCQNWEVHFPFRKCQIRCIPSDLLWLPDNLPAGMPLLIQWSFFHNNLTLDESGQNSRKKNQVITGIITLQYSIFAENEIRSSMIGYFLSTFISLSITDLFCFHTHRRVSKYSIASYHYDGKIQKLYWLHYYNTWHVFFHKEWV